MPAVKQTLKLLYHKERAVSVAKARIYEDFFDFEAVRMFCDDIGIEPGTLESAKHRCPFLLNIIESCGLASQSTASIDISTLALAPDICPSSPLGSDIGNLNSTKLDRRTVPPTSIAAVADLSDDGQISVLRFIESPEEAENPSRQNHDFPEPFQSASPIQPPPSQKFHFRFSENYGSLPASRSPEGRF